MLDTKLERRRIGSPIACRSTTESWNLGFMRLERADENSEGRLCLITGRERVDSDETIDNVDRIPLRPRGDDRCSLPAHPFPPGPTSHRGHGWTDFDNDRRPVNHH